MNVFIVLYSVSGRGNRRLKVGGFCFYIVYILEGDEIYGVLGDVG